MKPVVLLDTNVVIDLLAKREPFWQSAASIFDLAEQAKIDAYVNSLTMVTVYYILRSYYKIPHQQIIDTFTLLISYIGISDVTATHIRQAITSAFTDFEDAVMYNSATGLPAITSIITRNIDDFATADIPVLTPDQWLRNYHN
ncbi:PIN domain-containing protein [Spirosoma taeanense]|uniref:PIN domain-containing protein n=1 Tax=Spirosoma taeanense TaxID=2735870 RepID=A0A6M5Y7B3_9BACT|nr:PIN domain-containing protein [Spirosoma taeanense]QJW90247.1 PIN domain-containing protein [Spirosoma taeanense]